MTRRLLLIPFLVATLSGAAPRSPSRAAVTIHVRETAGIRRSAYPVGARVPIPRGALGEPSHARVLITGAEVAAQIAAGGVWPDGSIQWLDVNFNASVAANAEVVAQLEYGDEVRATATARGLTVSETPDAIQVGGVTFGRTLAPLIRSVKYRQEDIGDGMNGFALVDSGGVAHDAREADQVKVAIVKRGPLSVVLKYTGQIPVGGQARAPVTVTVEMPNSKTWIKVTTVVDDSGTRVRELSFHTPLALSGSPQSWDFGTGSWTYGLLRSAAESAELTQTLGDGATGSSWQVRNGMKGEEQIVERSTGPRPVVAEGWGHIQDAREAVAFAIDNFGRLAGTYTMSVGGGGQLSLRVAPARPQTQTTLTVYEHFVATPVPVGAVTSPVAMLNQLIVTVDPQG